VPEGPEVRRAADRIERVVRGERAREVYFAFPHLSTLESELEGRVVTRVETRGKAMLTWFDDALAVYSHNQLYGRWYVRKKPGLPRTNRTLRFAIHTDAGSALLYSASEIAVLAPEDIEAHPFLATLGPDPLDRGTTARVLRKRLASKPFARRQLARLLLDQRCVAGLGNYLRSEILFVAGVHPRRRPADLDADELAKLARTINLVCRRSHRTGGITTDAARVRAMRRQGLRRRQLRHYVFARAGRACRVCGATVRRDVMTSRRIYFCPRCQR